MDISVLPCFKPPKKNCFVHSICLYLPTHLPLYFSLIPVVSSTCNWFLWVGVHLLNLLKESICWYRLSHFSSSDNSFFLLFILQSYFCYVYNSRGIGIFFNHTKISHCLLASIVVPEKLIVSLNILPFLLVVFKIFLLVCGIPYFKVDNLGVDVFYIYSILVSWICNWYFLSDQKISHTFSLHILPLPHSISSIPLTPIIWVILDFFHFVPLISFLLYFLFCSLCCILEKYFRFII